MRILRAAAIVSLVAVLGASPALSQDANQQTGDNAVRDIMKGEISADKLALGKKLVELSRTGRLFDELLPNIADQAKNQFIRANPQMQLGIISVVDKIAVQMVSRRPELDEYLARVWASGFSEDEMRELVDFYSSDVGKKFAIAFPQILAVQTSAADEWAKSVGAELTVRVQEELRSAMAAENKALQGDVAGPAQGGAAAQEPATQQ